jgi:hypothetical protein
MTTARRLVRIIGALLVATALAACSAIKLGYEALDDVSYWWLDGYFAFDEQQSQRVRDHLQRLHAWHRANELPRVADLLARLEQLVPGPITATQACAFVPQVQARLVAVASQAEPAVVLTALELSPRQLRHLQRKSADNNRKWRREWIEPSASEQKDKRFKQALERLEMIYGRLDEPQRAALRAGIEQSIFDPQRIFTERQRRHQELHHVLRTLAGSQTSPAEARTVLRGYLERAQRPPDPAYRAYQQALLDESCRTFAAVHEVTTPAQREQAVRRLRAYQRDLRDLAAAAP